MKKQNTMIEETTMVKQTSKVNKEFKHMKHVPKHGKN